MAPFPETEIMTIKRLEVALRKLDFKLLKDGAYKLHEKYHSGFKFEYLDLLKDILSTVENTSNIPSEIKDILVPTIEDILTSTPIEASLEESFEPNRVSSLTSLSYSTNKEPDLKLQVEMQKNIQSPFSAQPFKEFSTPKVVVNTPVQEPQVSKDVEQTPEVVEEAKSKAKQIAIFFNDDETKTKKDINENSSIKELIIDYNFSDLSKPKRILELLNNKQTKADLITNSINPNLSTLGNTKVIPIYNLMNFFKCQKCGKTLLNKDLTNSVLALQCPDCKNIMLINNEFNLDNYNEANISLVEADVWVLINLNLNKKMENMLKTALKMNKKLEEIFLLDDNISIKENFKQVFESIKADANITTRNNDIDEFLNSVD